MEKTFKPKFKVGDVVCTKDDFHFNPVNKVVSIGRIEAIHIYKGTSLTRTKGCEPPDFSGRITYTISGFSLRPEEEDLQLFTEEI